MALTHNTPRASPAGSRWVRTVVPFQRSTSDVACVPELFPSLYPTASQNVGDTQETPDIPAPYFGLGADI
jgi:hypothetical protein